MHSKTKNNIVSNISDQSEKANKKLVFFMICSVVFGTLSFVSYKPIEVSKNDYSVALVNNTEIHSKTLYNPLNKIRKEKINSSSVTSHLNNKYTNTIISKNQFALIVGTYKKKYNAIILEKEMKKKGFKDCRIIINNNLKKYWVTVDLYKDKNDAKIARKKYLIDGWIKQI